MMKRTLHFCLLVAGLLLASNGAFAQTWEERIVNGDFEGSDYSSFAINVKNEGTRDLDANDIVVDDDDANNHCARISFTANPWVTEFIIKLTEPLSEGDMIQFSMRAKTSSSKDASLASNLGSEELEALVVKGGGEWNTCTYSGTVGAEQNGCQTITLRFNRTSSKSDIFHFDDISLKVMKDAPIAFADAKVKEICVNFWDTNRDGELSLYEAASVTEIYDYIFSRRTDITSFDELQYFVGLESIESYAFSGCTSLTSVVIPNSVKVIDSEAFSGCTSLVSIVLPNSVEHIWSQAFYNCSSLTSIELPSSLVELYNSPFTGCTSLTSLTIPKSVKRINHNPVGGCSSLTSLEVEEGNPSYDSRDNCNAIIETWSNKLVGGCKNTVIPNSVTSIGAGAFYGCGLTAIIIPNSVTSIGEGAFGGCSGLTSISIPNSVTSIDREAFGGCSGLTSIAIPNSVTSIGYDVFNGCSGLESIEVESNNEVYDSRENCNAIIMTAENKLVVGCKNTIIPSSVTTIGDAAFHWCSGLAAITIPEGVTTIEGGAFSWCTGLTSVSLPNSVTSIGNCAFQGCAGLEEVISHIEEPFEISKDVFGGYGIDAQWFDFTTATLYVPVGTKAKYEATPAWNLFQNIVEKDLTSIKETVQQTLDTAVPVIYNLSGQKLTTPKKGLNIINGKKVVIK